MANLKCLTWRSSITLEEYLNHQKATPVVIGKQGCYKQGTKVWIETYIRSRFDKDSSRDGELVAFEYCPKQFAYSLKILSEPEFTENTIEHLEYGFSITGAKELGKLISTSKAIRALRFSKYHSNKRLRELGISTARKPRLP